MSNSSAQSIVQSKIVVKLYSYDSSFMGNAIATIEDALAGAGVDICRPIPIPTRKKSFTVNRSPHVDKKSREHFEIRTYIRVIELVNCNQTVIERLLKIVLPVGVELKIRYYDN